MWNVVLSSISARDFMIPRIQGRCALLPRSHEIADLGDVRGQEADLPAVPAPFRQRHAVWWARRSARHSARLLHFSEAVVRAAVALAADIGIDSPAARATAGLALMTPPRLSAGARSTSYIPGRRALLATGHDALGKGGFQSARAWRRALFVRVPPPQVDFWRTDKPEIIDAYFTPAEGFRLAGVTYADATAPIAETPTIQWNHSLGEVVSALGAAGMRIQSLRHDGDVLHQWPMMIRGEDRLYRMQPWPRNALASADVCPAGD